MGKTKDKYTPEQWAELIERLKVARAKSQETRVARANQKKAPAAAEPVVAAAVAAEPVAEQPKRIAAPKPEPNVAGVDLDAYFAAKYKAKAAYLKPAAPAPAPEPVSQPTANLIRASATETIRGRVNDEIFKLAMKSVFPDM